MLCKKNIEISSFLFNYCILNDLPIFSNVQNFFFLQEDIIQQIFNIIKIAQSDTFISKHKG